MLRSLPFRAGRAALVLAVVALSACGDHVNPAETASDLRPQHLLPGGGGGGEPLPSLSSLSLSSMTLTIDGASVPYTVTVDDPISGWSLRSDMFQGSQQISFGAVAVPCGIPSPSCTVSSPFRAISGMVPGTATFRLQLLNKSGVVKGAKSVTVTIAPRPTIDGVNLSSLHILLDGPAVPYTVTLHNGGPSSLGYFDGELVEPGWGCHSHVRWAPCCRRGPNSVRKRFWHSADRHLHDLDGARSVQ